jgi:hypothetical protein
VVDAPELPPEAVLGLFTWDPSGKEVHYRELDVEISRWGKPENKNAQFVVQPYTRAGNIVRFDVAPGPLQHSFVWEAGRAAFRSAEVDSSGEATKTIHEHTFTSGVPDAAGAHVRVNLWLASRPARDEAVEVVVRAFRFRPLP